MSLLGEARMTRLSDKLLEQHINHLEEATLAAEAVEEIHFKKGRGIKNKNK